MVVLPGVLGVIVPLRVLEVTLGDEVTGFVVAFKVVVIVSEEVFWSSIALVVVVIVAPVVVVEAGEDDTKDVSLLEVDASSVVLAEVSWVSKSLLVVLIVAEAEANEVGDTDVAFAVVDSDTCGAIVVVTVVVTGIFVAREVSRSTVVGVVAVLEIRSLLVDEVGLSVGLPVVKVLIGEIVAGEVSLSTVSLLVVLIVAPVVGVEVDEVNNTVALIFVVVAVLEIRSLLVDEVGLSVAFPGMVAIVKVLIIVEIVAGEVSLFTVSLLVRIVAPVVGAEIDEVNNKVARSLLVTLLDDAGPSVVLPKMLLVVIAVLIVGVVVVPVVVVVDSVTHGQTRILDPNLRPQRGDASFSVFGLP